MAKCGLECEVYSRVVGYFRPVRDWNKGKREEFKDRINFKIGGSKCSFGTNTKQVILENIK